MLANFDGRIDTIEFNRCDFIRLAKTIYIDNQYNTSHILIDSCNFLSPNSGFYVAYANDITLQNCFFESPATGTTPVDFQIASNVNLIGNHFENAYVHFASTDGGGYSNPSIIVNNFFSSISNIALELSYSDYYKVYNNNIYGSGNFYAFYIHQSKELEVVNNNIYSSGTYNYTIQNSNPISYPIQSYNNNIFPAKIRYFTSLSN